MTGERRSLASTRWSSATTRPPAGVGVHRLRGELLVVTSLLTGVAVAVASFFGSARFHQSRSACVHTSAPRPRSAVRGPANVVCG
ncbi:hypothetical protein [Parafrankia sp. BMG5.11]|uniref:hypothetical protein n=1 Tax=Parafrankia sp. BMG5.11 TaxID=222540 RepID=UPI00103AFE3E|nr:hypothetical protein [Parafrankia sp. BMG5.11]TCJ34594.1 hypothetical protein E0504_31815 [Parafrankia sp. BMG5.11]